MKVKELIKDIKDNTELYSDLLKKIKPDSTDKAKTCESFITFALLYPLCKFEKDELCKLANFTGANDFTFSANVGDYIFKKVNLNEKGDISQYPGYTERKEAWNEYEKRYKSVKNAWNSLDYEVQEEWKKVIINRIYKDDKNKEKEMINNFKTDILFKGEKVPPNVTRVTIEECIKDNKKKISDLLYLRNTIWDEDCLFITTHRIQYKNMIDYFESYFIKPILGDEFTSKNDELLERYNELDCSYLIEKICDRTNDFEIANRIKNAYSENFELNKYRKVNNMSDRKSIENKIDKIISDGSKQIIFTGAPGTGKTYNVKKYVEEKCVEQAGNKEDAEKYYKFVQFHTSYDYSDFVEGLRPAIVKGQENNSFVRLDGIFKDFCRYIVEENNKDSNYNTSKNYYFIIDEINRADLSKVFGELMYGLEEDYRGPENAFDTQYKNLPTYIINENGKAELIENDCFKDGFYIPENLIIIGTMNDIDRSVETFDFALRRRFRWVEINANDVMEDALKEIRKDNTTEEIEDLIESAKAMNEVISSDTKIGLNKSFHIGPAYFKKGTKDDIWNTKVEPILYEYCRGRKADDTDEFIKDCRQAFFNRKFPENKENNTEEN